MNNEIFDIQTSKKVDKFLDKNRNIAIKYIEAIEILKISPFYNFLDIKKLKWKEEKYRLRIWKYRFLYEIIEDKILIYFYDAGGRWNIYK